MSDQDFFFDEDEQPKAAGKAPKASGSKKSAPAGPAAAPQTVTMTIAVLIGVIGLLAGLVVGILLPVGGATTATPAVTGGTAPQQQAPQLTEEQMGSGELPAGHPDIGGMGGSGAATGSAETTSK